MRLAGALLLIAAPAALGFADPAAAQDRPVTRPTRDVDVSYVATAGKTSVQQRIRTEAGAGLVRIDTPSPGLYIIVNRGAKTMDMVSEADHGVAEVPFDPKRGGLLPDDVAYTKLGTDQVAGLPCTEWATTDTAGRAVAACYTADGVLLRARTRSAVLVQAQSVSYGRLDPALFAIPAGYDRAVAPRRP